MITRKELCKKIEAMNPGLGACGTGYDVSFDRKVKAWAVDINRGKYHLKTFVETQEADSCLHGDRCIPLGLQVGQLQINFEKYLHEHALKEDH